MQQLWVPSMVWSLGPTSIKVSQPRYLGHACQEDTPWLKPHGKMLFSLGKAPKTVEQGFVPNWDENLFVSPKQYLLWSCGNVAKKGMRSPAVYDYCFVVNF